MTSGDAHRAMLNWRTLTFAPIDRRLIDIDLLDADSLAWLNAYHAETFDKIGPRVAPETKEWLRQATRPL